MNIFKVLSSGNGRLNETNVSAFLGYILDPKADHGIGSKFLESFLEPLVLSQPVILKELLDPINNNKIANLSYLSPYDVQIHYEKKSGRFNNIGKKEKTEVIDIVMLISKRPYHQSDIDSIFVPNIPVAMVLIENKINQGALNANQIKRQYDKTIQNLQDNIDTSSDVMLEHYKDNCFCIYVTPDAMKFDKEFKNLFTDEDAFNIDKYKGIILKWHKKIPPSRDGKNDKSDDKLNRKEDKINTVVDKLNNILEGENNGTIDAFQDYAKHTLKAFRNFISGDFQSYTNEVRSAYKDFSDFSRYCPYYLKLQNKHKHLIKQLHEKIINKYYSSKDLEDQFITYSTKEIRYSEEETGAKAFHISFTNRESIEIFYRSKIKIPLSSVETQNSAKRKNKESWLAILKTQNMGTDTVNKLLNIVGRSKAYTKSSEII